MSQLVIDAKPKPNIEQPRWDQSTYWGRAIHFFTITNPMNLLCNDKQLEEAKQIVEDYRKDKTNSTLKVDDLWRAKNIYDSAFHPDTKEKMILIGRMSAQVPMNMTITGCMMTFYKTTPQVIFWQWINQSFNAIVNYTNRSGENPIPVSQLGVSYVSATAGALITALGLNSLVKKAPPLIGRCVPWCAVAAANCVNIPCMRMRELQQGVTLIDENGNKLGESKIAARNAISMVVLSRVAMATPGMLLPPLFMEYLEKKPWFAKRRYLSAPIQVVLVGFFLVFATPMCCALFPQRSAISVSSLEPEVQREILAKRPGVQVVYYNKGL